VNAGGTPSPVRANASGPTEARTRLLRSPRRAPGPPEPGALRPLARALVDLAFALEHEDEGDERWMR
jgi:hypothetical protein